jgi:hypothetical protein
MVAVPEKQSLLKITKEPFEGGALYRVAGVIDTNFDQEKLLETATGIALVDLDGVRRISSYGVRQWVKTMKAIPATYVGFVRVRPELMMQFNIMTHFAGKGELLSFYLPYVCGPCGEATDLLLDVESQYEQIRAFTIPAVTCGACGAEAQFDDVPESYLAHPAEAPRPNPPAALRPLIKRL